MIDNFKTAAKISVALGVLLVITVVLYIFSLIEYAHRKTYLILGSVTLLVYLIMLLKKLHYFGLNIENNTLIIRFYNPHPFISNYKQIKIPLEEYDGYELKKHLFGQEIIFKIRRGKQTGKYPPVSITALSKDQKQQLFEILDGLNSEQ